MKKDTWILKTFLTTFIIAICFNTISNVVISKFESIIILTIILVLFIFIGILFDIYGTAVLTADESTFHAMSSKRIKGAKTGVYLIKNNHRIASIFCDIIGDICGIISGGVCALISLLISTKLNISTVLILILISSIVSSLTIGGKAIGKKYAIKKADNIVHSLSKILEKFKRSN